MQYCQYRIDDTFYPLVTARPDTISSFKIDQALKKSCYMDYRLWTNPKLASLLAKIIVDSSIWLAILIIFYSVDKK